MAVARLALAANTWTDLSAYGTHFILRSEGGAVVQVGIKATAPTAKVGDDIPANGSGTILIGEGSTAKAWARIVAGGYISIDSPGTDAVYTVAGPLSDA